MAKCLVQFQVTTVHYYTILQMLSKSQSDSVEAQRPTQHIIGHFGDNFYRPDDQTDSVKALNKTTGHGNQASILPEPLHVIIIQL